MDLQPHELDPETFCRTHLTWAERQLRHRFGERGVEFAGVGLVTALKAMPHYDPDRPFKPWLRQVVIDAAISEMRGLDGRAGGAKALARLSSTTLEDYDRPVNVPVDRAAIDGEWLYRTLSTILNIDPHQHGRARMILLCMTLTDLNKRDIARLVGVRRKRFRDEIAPFRRFLSAG